MFPIGGLYRTKRGVKIHHKTARLRITTKFSLPILAIYPGYNVKPKNNSRSTITYLIISFPHTAR